MNNIWCEDIVYNILINLDLPTLHVMQLVAKLSNNICNNNNFWEYMLKKDYGNFMPSSDKFKHEYEQIYLSHKFALQMRNLCKNGGKFTTACVEINDAKIDCLPYYFQQSIIQVKHKSTSDINVWFKIRLDYPGCYIITMHYRPRVLMRYSPDIFPEGTYANNETLLNFIAHLVYIYPIIRK